MQRSAKETRQTSGELRAEVERARERFHGSKVEVDALKHRNSPSFYASMKLYAFIGNRSKDPPNSLMEQMFEVMMCRMQEEQRRREREEAERRCMSAVTRCGTPKRR